MENQISVKSLCKTFGNHKVLDKVNLDVKPGTSLVILGGSGTGKSVLIKSIIGIIKPDSGSIEINGVNTICISDRERFKILETCGFVFQGGALFDSLNIEDNITFSVERLGNLPRSAKRDIAIKKLKSVGLPEKVLELYPAELSGGMLKRAAIARAIFNNLDNNINNTNPKIIFFDEPTTGLDPIMANVINDLIIKVKKELGATTITITHDMTSAYAIADEIALLHQGKIIWKGTKEEMKTSDNPYLNQFINGHIEGPIEVYN